MRRLRLLALLGATALAGACGSSTSTATSSTSGTSGSSSTTGGAASSTSTSAAGPTTLPPGFGTGTASGAATATSTALLVRLSVARNPGFDRIVFEFQGTGLPGYEVKYVQPPLRQDASGNIVQVAGTAFLNIRMEHASGFDLDHGTPTYQGPEAIPKSQAGTVVIEEVHRLGDFEAVLTWAAGLNRNAPFRVTTTASPARIILDVANGT